jgi:DNA-binding FadR family transcriptional regulator
VRGELQEGESLPAEPELMRHFKVSRPTLREAFRILESERFITVRRGARGGARVQLPDPRVAAQYAGLLLQVRGATLGDVYQARLLIEPPLAGLFAERHPDVEVAQMRIVLTAEEQLIGRDPAGLAVLFSQFHQVIVNGAGNVTLAVLAGMLANIAEKHVAAEIAGKQGRPEQEADNRRAFKAHRRLAKLVEERNGPEAERFWRTHMEIAGQLLLKEYGSRTVVDLLA